MNLRRDFMCKSAAASLAVGATFMGFPKRADASNMFWVKVTKTGQKGRRRNTHTNAWDNP